MPQMSPMNWLFLYIYMLMILMIVNVILNYLYLIKLENKKIYLSKDPKTFKWMW